MDLIASMWGVSVTLSYILGVVFKMRLNGVWIAFAADECFRGILMFISWKLRVWEKNRIIRI
ncbi:MULTISPECIES: hypothetical protein [Clostridium]|uniref:hypothetical protein n=1 Tax=Clostridium TaxID=1485 RepID=UPI00061FA158|nr:MULTISPECIES: hypothetical protein [Clostridium]KJZ85895.1 hypothetical protein ClosIBUN22A_CONTIG69g01429 [Clostridium sp. IBUN22A]KJZ88821.1 hypothetical protein ClosIBUN125C_CONTIG19g01317 [Clostridium sp. IBUN125C]KJZ94415.1 hypothetical protein ClosIBUN13A_CONTIG188g03064 [Clostridium sp. IBUN13A]MCI3010306.1 hypothetical protein [Clostridium butyricum]MDM8131025.1 hypothetical protein [Clostridium butyricum]